MATFGYRAHPINDSYDENLRIRTGQMLQRLVGDAINRPVIHGLSSQCLIEADRWLIPIQNRPFKPAAAALKRQLRKSPQQSRSESMAPRRRTYIKIFQINAGFRQKR